MHNAAVLSEAGASVLDVTRNLADSAAGALAVLATSDVDPVSLATVGDDELREAVLRMQTVANAALAFQADALAEMGRRARAADQAELTRKGYHRHSAEESLLDELSILLSTTKAAVSRLYDRAVRASASGPLMQAWRSGLVDAAKADAIVRTHELCRGGMNAHDLDSLTTKAITYACRRTAPQLREWLRRREIAVDPASAERRRRQAMLERRVVIRPADDGMCELFAVLPNLGARSIQQTLDRVARQAASGDPRTMDQRRADALVELVTGEAEPPASVVHVVVPAATLDGTSQQPGWLPGVGPITADEARAAAGVDGEPTGRAVYRRLLADPVSGALTDVSEQRYRPSASLERAVRSRDVTCRFPGCRRSALGAGTGTDLDHTVPWPVGSTSAANLAVLCRRHHRLKHTPGWSVVLNPDGSMTWTTPTGRQFSSEPWAYLDPVDPVDPIDTATADDRSDEESGPDPPQRE